MGWVAGLVLSLGGGHIGVAVVLDLGQELVGLGFELKGRAADFDVKDGGQVLDGGGLGEIGVATVVLDSGMRGNHAIVFAPVRCSPF